LEIVSPHDFSHLPAMRIDRLQLKNFKCFAERRFEFRPGFNLIVGENGSGKTSLLEALAVASGSWLLGLSNYSSHCKARSILPSEVTLKAVGKGDGGARYERHFPVEVTATGQVASQEISWTRTLEGVRGRTKSAESADLKRMSEQIGRQAMEGEPVTLPLISYYGTGRLWQQPRDLKTKRAISVSKDRTSVFSGYANSHDPRSSAADLFRWIQTQQFIALEDGETPVALRLLTQAVIGCIEGGRSLHFSVKLADLILEIEGQGGQPFNNLSDGYRNMIAMLGDITFKALTLNPHLGMKAAAMTPGVVLIDELDLHLHPKWQRRVIDDLKRTFPMMQLICTSHSPFLIQSLQPGELISLCEGEGEMEYSGQPIENIIEDVQGVQNPQRSRNAEEADHAAEAYFTLLQQKTDAHPRALAEAELRYRKISSVYSDHSVLDAILKLEALAAVQKGGKK
jgi:predicted ATP-binding protein involved in virulence